MTSPVNISLFVTLFTPLGARAHLVLNWGLNFSVLSAEAMHTSSNGIQSLIGLAILSDVSQLIECNNMPDHSYLEIKQNSLPTSTNLKRQVWSYKNADFTKAYKLIDSVIWDSMLTEDIDSSLFLWQQRFMFIMEDCMPHTTFTFGSNFSTPLLSNCQMS